MVPHALYIRQVDDGASRIPPRRRQTLRTWLRSARNFGKTRFGRFAIFDFSTPKFFFEKSFRSNLFFQIFLSVFHHFRQILEERGIFGRQNRIPRGIFALDSQIFRSVQRLEPIS